jgi:hypothetical protein
VEINPSGSLCIGLGRIVSWARPLMKVANGINGLQRRANLWGGAGDVFLTAKRRARSLRVTCPAAGWFSSPRDGSAPPRSPHPHQHSP